MENEVSRTKDVSQRKLNQDGSLISKENVSKYIILKL
jgi:hypothetical protein